MAIGEFERLVLDDFCGLQESPRWVSRAVSALPQLVGRHEEIFPILTRHKAFTFFDASLRRLAERTDVPAASALAEQFKDWLDESRDHYRLLTAELNWMSSKGLGEIGQVAAIKGLSNARFYRNPGVRWSRDIDLFLPSWEHTVRLVEVLRGRGYEFDPGECPWIKAEPRRGRSEYGQVFLIRPVDDGYTRVDLHFGTYSVSHGEYLQVPLIDFYEPGPLARLNATGTLLVMFAHALSDGYVSIKDANDCAAMAAVSAPVDWPTVREQARRHSFAPQAAVLSRYLARQYAEEEPVAEFAARLSEAASLQSTTFTPLWRMHDRSWVRRAVVNAGYTFRAALRQRRGLRSAVARAMQCFAFYVRRLDVGVRRRSVRERLLLQFMPKSNLSRWRLRSDACPTLVHLNHPAVIRATGTTLVPTRIGESFAKTPLPQVWVGDRTVLIGSDLFIYTWDQCIEPDELEQVRRAGEEVSW